MIFSLFCSCGCQWVRAEAGSGPGPAQPGALAFALALPAPRTDLFGAGEVRALCLAEVAAPRSGRARVQGAVLRPSPPLEEEPSVEKGCVRVDGSSRLAEDL